MAEYRTKSGKLLTDDDIQALADEAERGYDVSHLESATRPDRVQLFLPKPGSFVAQVVARGSAIVGRPHPVWEADRVIIDYEGAVYGQENMRRYADRCAHACGRQWEALTHARMETARENVIAVGWYFPATGHVVLDQGAEILVAAWLGVRDADLDDELRRERV